MGRTAIIALVVVGLILLFGFGIVMMAFGINNLCVTSENGIKAQYDQNKNSYDNYFKKVAEAAQVPEMYRDDLKKVYDGVMAGRYGANGSKAVMHWITENNPNFSPDLYIKIQQMIEAGRNKFESDQKDLISRKQQYNNYLGSMPNGFLAHMMGFPKVDLEKYKIVTSDETENAFEEGKSKPLELRPKNEKKE